MYVCGVVCCDWRVSICFDFESILFVLENYKDRQENLKEKLKNKIWIIEFIFCKYR